MRRGQIVAREHPDNPGSGSTFARRTKPMNRNGGKGRKKVSDRDAKGLAMAPATEGPYPPKTTGPAPLSVLMKRVDRKAARYAKQGGVCQLAGYDGHPCWGPLDAAHIVPRDRRHIRHEWTNFMACCRGHHTRYEKSPLWPAAVAHVFGPDRLPALEALNEGRIAQFGTNLRPLYEMEELRLDALLKAVRR